MHEDELREIRHNRALMQRGLDDFKATDELASYGRSQHNDFRDDVKWIAAFSTAALLATSQFARDQHGGRTLLVIAVAFFLISIGAAIAYVWRPYRKGINRLGQMKLMLADWSKVANELTYVYNELEAALVAKKPDAELVRLRADRVNAEEKWKDLPDHPPMSSREILEAKLHTLASLVALIFGLLTLVAAEMGLP